MKKETHPTYHADAKVICACGHTFTVGSTVKELNIELCSQCHPFYTGKQKLVDTARRVEKFHERVSKQNTEAKVAKTAKKVARSTRSKKSDK